MTKLIAVAVVFALSGCLGEGSECTAGGVSCTTSGGSATCTP